jgi:nitronate monooxygenase
MPAQEDTPQRIGRRIETATDFRLKIASSRTLAHYAFGGLLPMLITPLTRHFGLRHPVVLAPMSSISAGRLTAAVSRAGGLGLLGGAYGDLEWQKTEIDYLADHASRPWGVGFITWSASTDVVEAALACRPDAVMLSFGNPTRLANLVKSAGVTLLCQVQTPDGAREAVQAGADFVIAQGTEAGGHGEGRSLLPLLVSVIDAVPDVPVLAAGGISDGRGLAGVLAMGAAGALVGTRFFASIEASAPDAFKQTLVRATAEQTARSAVFDIVRDYAWPSPYTGRTIMNTFYRTWKDREAELRSNLCTESPAYFEAAGRGDAETAMIGAGEGVDQIRSIETVEQIMHALSRDAEAHLRGLSSIVQ